MVYFLKLGLSLMINSTSSELNFTFYLFENSCLDSNIMNWRSVFSQKIRDGKLFLVQI